jgi:hypothetical protein
MSRKSQIKPGMRERFIKFLVTWFILTVLTIIKWGATRKKDGKYKK